MTPEELHIIIERSVVDYLREYETAALMVMHAGGRVPNKAQAPITNGGLVAVLCASAVQMAMVRYDMLVMVASFTLRGPMPPVTRIDAEHMARACATKAMKQIGW